MSSLRLLPALFFALVVYGSNASADFEALLAKGRACVEQGDYKQATDVLEQAAGLNPSDSHAFLWLGRAYGHRAEKAFPLNAPGLAKKARENFEKAVELDPRNRDAVDDLFDYYLQAPAFLGGGADKAAHLIDRATQAEPSQAVRYAGKTAELGRYLAKHGRFGESDETFRKALAAAPGSPTVIFFRASSLVDANRNLPEARQLLQRYLTLTLAPNDPPRKQAEKLLRKASGS